MFAALPVDAVVEVRGASLVWLLGTEESISTVRAGVSCWLTGGPREYW